MRTQRLGSASRSSNPSRVGGPAAAILLSIFATTACSSSATPTSPTPISSAPPAAARPGCGPPAVTLLGTSNGTTIKATVGKPVTVSVRIDDGASRFVSGTLAVGRPDSVVTGVGVPQASLGTNAVERVSNQLSTRTATATNAGSTVITLTFTPSASGNYPVVISGSFADCGATAPASSDIRANGSFEGRVGTISA